jgi:hypothetical protein
VFAAPASQEVPWDAAVIYQVNERVAPSGVPSRTLTHLTEALGSAPATVLPTPLNDAVSGWWPRSSLRHRQENLLAARTQPAAEPD